MNGSGYGYCQYEGERIGVHVAAYLKAGGTLKRGEVVKHSCDNRRCINPDHLSAGTFGENNTERGLRAKRNGVNLKLTEDDVRAIKAALSAGVTQSVLARRFSVHQTAISAIKRGKNYGGVTCHLI
ncbi:hypothetical protein IVIADoCa2_18 [Xanthomonas phage vB_Xar_IVIA-DoCa2]|uniref:HNH nuclease domain-containing protein n=1 Tax=Xanthomonas phage vB_Xar_IVIA-DoCa2 TaxID=2970491 RepID=A0A976SH51_9CAUD|nr:hypothetical protein IVIADoCa2_18 [Xanthomonas phage vB_Xar_IVIA-DoCa2]